MPTERTPEMILSTYMAGRGLKATRQRQIILGAFLEAGGHITVEELLARARSADSRISTATVYRTIKLLSECGLAKPQQFGSGHTVYEPTAGKEHHDHLVCTGCGLIVEFEDDRIEHLQEAAAQSHGFRVTHHRMELYGLCRGCQKTEASRSTPSR